jgi:hypothetical protein
MTAAQVERRQCEGSTTMAVTTHEWAEADRLLDRMRARADELLREAETRRFREEDDRAREPYGMERVAAALRGPDPATIPPQAFVEAMRRRPELRRQYAEARRRLLTGR